MPNYIVMGSTPGDGSVVSAETPKEAFARFCALDGILFDEVFKAISEGDESWENTAHQFEDDPNDWIYGDYEIKLIK